MIAEIQPRPRPGTHEDAAGHADLGADPDT